MLKAFVLNDTRVELHHGCSRVMNNIDYILRDKGITFTSNYVHDDWTLSEKVKKQILNSDFVIVNGEGTIHHERVLARKLLQVSEFCKFYGKKIYLINSTIQAMDTQDSLEWLSLFDFIFVRESYSYEYLNKLGIRSRVVPDMTFYSNVRTKNITRSGIAFTCSVYDNYSYLLAKCSLSNDSEYSVVTYTGIREHKPFYMHFSSLANTSKQKIKTIFTRPYYSFNKIIEKIKRKIVFSKVSRVEFSDHISYQKYLSSKELIVSGRFHAMCMSIATKTPFITLASNSFKVNGVMKDAGISLDRLKDINDIQNCSNFKCFEYTPEEIEGIERYLELANKSIDNMFNLILDDYNGL